MVPVLKPLRSVNRYLATTEKGKFELNSLPPLLSKSKWTVYLDNVSHLDTQSRGCTEKWFSDIGSGQAALVNVRPDGYVGSITKFSTSGENAGQEAARSLDDYYVGFLQMPQV